MPDAHPKPGNESIRNPPTTRPKADVAARPLMHRLAPRQLGIAAGQNESKAPRRNLRLKLNAWCKRTPRRRKLKVAHRLRVLCFAVWRSLRFYDPLAYLAGKEKP